MEFAFDEKSCIYWIGFQRCPTKNDVDDIVNAILQTDGPLIVHAEHTEQDILMPSIDIIFHISQHLNKHKQVISDRLIATIIQPYKLDNFATSIINIALQIYKPQKPLCITDNKKKIQKFIKQLSF
tara:strand:+ start:5299 stop:5676 length:378 start_codon:yes stop_codon:yes gene_type:complete